MTMYVEIVSGAGRQIVELTPEQITEFGQLNATPLIPSAVSPRQIRQALTRAGLRTAVEQAVLVGDQDLKDWWEYSAAFERQHEQVQAMADALGVSAQQLDDLWILAATL